MATIEAIDSPAALQAVIRQFHAMGIGVPFAVSSLTDPHDPANVIANVAASGLGLPDRDYYFKAEPRFVEARKQYVLHVRELFMLAGEEPGAAEARRRHVMRARDEARRRVARQRRAARSAADRSQDDVRRAAEAHAALRLDAPTSRRATCPTRRPQRRSSRSSCEAVERELTRDAARGLEDLPELARCSTRRRRLAVEPVRRGGLRVLRQVPDRREGDEAALEALRGGDRRAARRGARPEVRREALPARGEGAHAGAGERTCCSRCSDTIEGLDWMSARDEGARAREARHLQSENRLPGQVEGLQPRRRSSRDALLGQRGRRPALQRRRRSRDRSASRVDRGRWGMTPPTSNAYYNPLLNEIVFPAGILQPPAFSVDAVDAVNYGAIGVVIGHEISHGFDDQGAQFDAQGRLNNWWTAEDLKKFQERGAVRRRSVRRLLHRARHPSQRQARARRDRSAIWPARRSRTWRSRRRSRRKPGADASTASRPTSSSSSRGGSSAATTSAPSSRGRWCRAIRTRSPSTA